MEQSALQLVDISLGYDRVPIMLLSLTTSQILFSIFFFPLIVVLTLLVRIIVKEEMSAFKNIYDITWREAWINGAFGVVVVLMVELIEGFIEPFFQQEFWRWIISLALVLLYLLILRWDLSRVKAHNEKNDE